MCAVVDIVRTSSHAQVLYYKGCKTGPAHKVNSVSRKDMNPPGHLGHTAHGGSPQSTDKHIGSLPAYDSMAVRVNYRRYSLLLVIFNMAVYLPGSHCSRGLQKHWSVV